MKILLVTNLYDPYSRGGAESVVKNMAQGLIESGDDVTVFTAGPLSYGLGGIDEDIGGVKVFRFFPLNIFFIYDDYRHSRVLRFLWRLIDIFNFHSALIFLQFIKKEKPCVIITHNLVGLGMLLPWIIKIRKIKHVHVLHDAQLIYPSGLLMWGEEKKEEGFLSRRIYEKLMRHLFGSPSLVISPSKWLMDLHLNRSFFGRSRTAVLPNPVNFIQLQEETKSLKDKIRLLYAGQLEKHKGISWLLNFIIFSDLEVVLEIAGSGFLAESVKDLAEKYPQKIIYHGRLTREDLTRKFFAVSALIVPSLCYENRPQIIDEALAFGLPVLASRIGGIPEIIIEGENGFLFNPQDEQDLARVLNLIPNLIVRPRSSLMNLREYIEKLKVLI